MEFKENFKNLIDRNETNQTNLAKVVGFTPQTVSKWYNGKTEPDTKTIKKIAKYFNVSTDYLLGNDEINNNDEKQKEIDALKKMLQRVGYMENDEDLTDEELEKLIEFVNANKKFLKGDK